MPRAEEGSAWWGGANVPRLREEQKQLLWVNVLKTWWLLDCRDRLTSEFEAILGYTALKTVFKKKKKRKKKWEICGNFGERLPKPGLSSKLEVSEGKGWGPDCPLGCVGQGFSFSCH